MPRETDTELLRMIAKRIRAARKDRNLTQEALAELAGTQPETISRVERLRNGPSLGLLLRLAGALDLELSELVDRGRKLPAPLLAPDERRLLTAWHRLSPEAKAAALVLLEELN